MTNDSKESPVELIAVDDPAPGVRRITLNRPEKRNAINNRMRAELFATLEAADLDDAVHVTIVRGAGTCFSSGYDLTASREAFTAILDEFEEVIGEPPLFFHLNDSAGELGANKDRHVLIGDGLIGEKPFEWLMQDHRSDNIPLILETPQQNYEITDEDDSPDPYDVKMMKMLEGWTRN